MNRDTIRVRDRVADRFVLRGALSPESAIAYAPQGWFERRLVERLRKNGALVEVRPGYFYLDIATYHAAGEALARRALPIAFWGALAISVIALLFYKRLT